jgi:hypothetical protein
MTTDYRTMCAELLEWAERTSSHYYKQADVIVRARALLAQPVAEAPAEALAARPLLEQVAAMADCIGAHTVGQITAISDRAAAWLRENPPGQPVAIEPRGCPTPGACSCVEPESKDPTDKELWAAGSDDFRANCYPTDAIAYARAVLAKWGTLTPQPVAVSERLPGPEDCDEQGRCWMFGNVEGDWRLISTINPGIPKLKYCFSHWLPANALPTPEDTNDY